MIHQSNARRPRIAWVLCLSVFLLLAMIPNANAQQCPSSRQCNATCCLLTEACHLGACVALGTSCSAAKDCKATEYCETKLGHCFPRQGANLQCEYKPPTGNFKPNFLWEWKPTITQEYIQSMMTPVVMALQDSNADGKIDDKDIPSVAVVAMQNYFGGGRGKGAVRVLRGTDGKLLFTAGTGLVHGWSSLALGDIDGDGKPEIIAQRYNSANGLAQGLIAFDNTGKVKWISRDANGNIAPTFSATTTYYGAPVITDLDGDGKIEIASGGAIFRGSDGRFLCMTQTNAQASFAADIDGDGKLEIVTGSNAYDINCKAKWTTTGPNQISALADFNNDGKPEVVGAGGSRVNVTNGQTGANIASISIPSDDTGGKGPVLGDVDGDGIPEIGVSARNYYYMFKFNFATKALTQMWRVPSRDFSSSGVSSSMFDFNFDGKIAVVFNDEIASYILEGLTGKIFLKDTTHTSGTVMEYPIVVDVDGDGRAETVSATNLNAGIGRVRVTREIGYNWVNTRPVWNQYQYNVTNICTGDKFCPAGSKFGQPARKPFDNWKVKGLNNFRVNAYGGHSDMDYKDTPFSIPDLAVRNVQTQWKNCATNQLEVIFQVSNIGSLRTKAGVPVTVYQGTASAKVKLLTVTTTRTLVPGATEYFVVTVPPLLTSVLSIYIVADDNGAAVSNRRECNEGNNSLLKSFLPPSTDPYCLGVVNDPPKITGTPGTSATEDTTYTFAPGVTDPDPLNKHVWTKVAGPATATVDPATGKVTWTPTSADVGKTLTFSIRVCDDAAPPLCDTKTWTVTVVAAANPPQIVGTPDGTGSANQGYGYSPKVVDPDSGDTHKWAGTTLPPGATIDTTTGEVKWTPKASDTGKDIDFAIQVCDQTGLCATQTWKVRVGSGNQLPQIIGTPGQLAEKDKNYAYRPNVRDPDVGDTHKWTLNKGPAGATIDPSTGAVDWIPGPNDIGKEFEFSITVCDSANNCATQTWRVRVGTPANTPPQIGGVPPTIGKAGQSYAHAPSVIDPDVGDTHTWTLVNGPAGATINPTTGSLAWSPSANDAGKEVEFTIKVCDKGGECATQTWRVKVDSSNNPPAITSTPTTTADVGKDYKYPAKATDPDTGDTQTWRLIAGPAGAKVDPTTGEVTWKPGPNDDKTSPVFELEVCDKAGACVRQSWQVRVGTTGNTPPTIDGRPGVAGTAGTAYTYAPKVTDPDANDTHVWSLKTAPTGATIDKASGQISWTPSAVDQGKSVEFGIVVCDKAGACATQTWRVKVGANNPPQIDGAPLTTATPATAYTFAPKVIDPDTGDKHTWKGTKLPPGATVDPATGAVSWTPKADDVGKIFDFTVEVCDDKGACASRQWRVKVLGTSNTPPVITGTPSNDGTAGSAYTFSPGVNDPDVGDTHTWKGNNLPVGATIDPSTGKLTWTPKAADVGKDIALEIEVCDKAGACATRTWKVRVSANGKPPQLVGAPETQAKPLVPYTFAPSLKDPDPNETYAWKLKAGPTGATVDPKTGKLLWTPTLADVGKVFEFEIEVCDSNNRCAKRKWKVRVTTGLINTPPLITSIPPVIAAEGRGYHYKPVVTDPDAADVHTWKGNKLPPGATIDPSTGEIKWTPGPGDAGKVVDFEIQVCDKAGRCDTQSWKVTVGAKNSPPKITSTAPNTGYVGEDLVYSPTVQDSDANDQHRWQLLAAPPGASIDPVTGKVTWKPTSADADKPAVFAIQVCDNGTPRLCDTQTYTVTPRNNCRVDVDCKAGQICIKDKQDKLICADPGCADDNPLCPTPGNFCQDGSCKVDPCDNKTCGAGEFCRPTDGKCVKPCAGVTCQAGETCVDGACAKDPCATLGTACQQGEICDVADPQKPVCIKNPCNDQSCRHGRVCSSLGICVDNPCPKIKCPDTNQQRCLAGQCVDLQPCAIDIQCPGEEVCYLGKCREPGCYTNLSLCNAGGVCLQTQCQDNQCPAPGGKACTPTEFCRAGDPACTATCGNVNCPSGELCEDGLCKNDPCANKTCASGFVCVSGDCKKDNCSTGSNQCKHGRVCNQQLSVCDDDRCRFVKCPGANELCLEGQCITKDCQFDKDCTGDDVCIKNKCVIATCKQDSDCVKGERCIDGKCVTDSCDGKQCKDNEFCSNGNCVPTCAGVFCEDKKICFEGQCVDDPCANAQCQADETCQNGKCVKDQCKGQTDPCKHGRVCNVDKCSTGPCDGIVCKGKEQCKSGQCTGDRACQVDVQCPGDAVCINKTCTTPGCYTDQSCSAPKLCTAANCGDNPCDNKTCGADETCRPVDGQCIKNCPRCPTGEICQQGACVADPCDNVDCGNGGTCDAGKCIPDLCQANTPQCRHGRACKLNSCIDDLCANIKCANGQQCREGICYGDISNEPTPGEPGAEPKDEVTVTDAGPDKSAPETNADTTPDQPAGLSVSGGCGCQTQQPFPASLLLLFACLLFFFRRSKHSQG